MNITVTLEFGNPGIPESKYTSVVNCIKNKMTYAQVAAIVEKHMEENPSDWHYAMPSLT
jgi:hypothetical protein